LKFKVEVVEALTSPLCVVVVVMGVTWTSVGEDALLLVVRIVEFLDLFRQRQEEVDLGLGDDERSESRLWVA
jgi:hypothetical protein